MGVKKLKPTSPGSRFKSVSDFSEITTDRPYKPLVRPLKRTARSYLGEIRYTLET